MALFVPAVDLLSSNGKEAHTVIGAAHGCHVFFQCHRSRQKLEDRTRLIGIVDHKVTPHFTQIFRLFAGAQRRKLFLFALGCRLIRIVWIEVRFLGHCEYVSRLRIHNDRKSSVALCLLHGVRQGGLRITLDYFVQGGDSAVPVDCLVIFLIGRRIRQLLAVAVCIIDPSAGCSFEIFVVFQFDARLSHAVIANDAQDAGSHGTIWIAALRIGADRDSRKLALSDFICRVLIHFLGDLNLRCTAR